jgi:S-adenosylmethionine:tRNA ribosyltransferase-isomerase
MKTEELNYELPSELIAQKPVKHRSQSRLLVLMRAEGKLIDSHFSEIGRFLKEGDCLVLNDTKVLQGRFFAQRKTGGRLEGLFLSENQSGLWEVLFKGAGKVKEGEEILIKNRQGEDYCRAVIESKLGQGMVVLQVEAKSGSEKVLEVIGFPPLPPYIKRDRDLETAKKDRQRYQTVYARQPGAVAAPTAGSL